MFCDIDQARVSLFFVYFRDCHQVMGGAVGQFIFVEFLPSIVSHMATILDLRGFVKLVSYIKLAFYLGNCRMGIKLLKLLL